MSVRNLILGVAAAALFAGSVGAQSIGPGGGGTTAPGGTTGQIEYNLSGEFGGFTMAGDCTLSIPTVTCTKLNSISPGTAFGANTGSNGHNVPFLDAGNTWSSQQIFNGSTLFQAHHTLQSGGDFSINGVSQAGQIAIATTSNPSITSGLGTGATVSNITGTLAFMLSIGSRRLRQVSWACRPPTTAGIARPTTSRQRRR